jgi:hypothetical protein
MVCVTDLGFDWIQGGVLCIPHPYLTPYIGITVKYRSLLLSSCFLFSHAVMELVIEVKLFKVAEKGRRWEG